MVAHRFIVLLQCITIAAGRSNKIINGVVVDEGDFQYVVSLQDQNREPKCGGSLLSLSWILTACHCMIHVYGDHQYLKTSDLIAVAGSLDITAGGKNQVRDLQRFITDPYCEDLGTGMKNDYGLCETMKPFEPGPKLKHIRVFSWDRVELFRKTNELIRNNYKCQVVGWGNQNILIPGFYYNTSKVLMKTNVYLSDHHRCNQDLCAYFTKNSKCGIDYVFSRGQFCAYGTNKSDACSGDSGGPVSCNGSVYGLVSLGPYCGEEISPTTYSRLDNTEFFNKIRDLSLGELRNTCSVIRTSMSIFPLLVISSVILSKNKA